jgi:hypothetical protein
LNNDKFKIIGIATVFLINTFKGAKSILQGKVEKRRSGLALPAAGRANPWVERPD